MRWPSVHWELARAWGAAAESDRLVLAAVFDGLNEGTEVRRVASRHHKAIQEQQTTISTYATETATLRAQNAALEARIASVEQALQQMLVQARETAPNRRQP